MDTIAEQTYAVLDLPAPVADRILEIRRRHRDDFRAALPAEVTLVGSNGVGCFVIGQPAHRVFEVLDQIAAETPPIEAALGRVERFPISDIFVFRLVPESPLWELHERIAQSGLAFDPSPFPFGPHVTLRSRSPVSDDEARGVLAERIAESFVLRDLSVYRLERDTAGQVPVICRLLHRARLTLGLLWTRCGRCGELPSQAPSEAFAPKLQNGRATKDRKNALRDRDLSLS